MLDGGDGRNFRTYSLVPGSASSCISPLRKIMPTASSTALKDSLIVERKEVSLARRKNYLFVVFSKVTISRHGNLVRNPSFTGPKPKPTARAPQELARADSVRFSVG